MKKLLTLLFAVLLVFVVSACDDKESEIFLITDKGNIDDKSFNQGSWEGVKAFGKDKGISYDYIKPEDATNDAYLAAIKQAVERGAKVIVTPGFLFEVPVYEAQTLYPEVKFILLDGAPHSADGSDSKSNSNVASIMYAEEQSGFLAGYAAVKDGYRKLGFMGGMAVPAVQAFGYGFLQGAEYAAAELGLEPGSVEVKYHYTGDFEENAKNKQTAKTMFQEGVEVIFACGGSVGKSVMAAAQESSAKVIGVDVDQRHDSTTVITSATKGLKASVYQVLESIYDSKDFETKYGGKTTYFNAENQGVGLPENFDRFNNFTKAEYEAIYNKLVSKEVAPKRTIDVAATDGIATKEELTNGLSLTKVKVEVR